MIESFKFIDDVNDWSDSDKIFASANQPGYDGFSYKDGKITRLAPFSDDSD